MKSIARESKEVAIERIMRGLKCSRAEAEDVYDYDCKVKRDEKTEYDLPPDKMKIAQMYTRTGTRKMPTAYKFTKRERKPNATKGGLIEEFATFLTEKSDFAVENVQIVNKERQIQFTIGENTFEITLVQKRKPKN